MLYLHTSSVRRKAIQGHPGEWQVFFGSALQAYAVIRLLHLCSRDCVRNLQNIDILWAQSRQESIQPRRNLND
jgi:hypothetical protein